MNKMPVLQPLPIKTKGLGFFARYKAWMFDRRKWKVFREWEYKWENDIGITITIIIPAKFILDGASIPRIFWVILSPTGILLIPAVIHDYGYRYGYIWTKTKQGKLLKFGEGQPRKYWDRLFKTMAIEVNGFKFVNKIAWAAVKIGGGRIWKKYRKVTD